MKIYFDESGQTGCVLQNDDLLNFQGQPTFAVGAVVLKSVEEEKEMIDKYTAFKKKYNIQDEIKGKDLLIRVHNEELEYILENVFDKYHFFVIIYDKRFYIATLLLISLLGFEYQHLMPEHFYMQATFLSQQGDDFFVRYLKYIQSPSVEKFSGYLQFLIHYEYKNIEMQENAVVEIARRIIEEKSEEKWWDSFLTYGWYDDPNVTNLINLTALSELICFIKSQCGEINDEIIYIHDHINEFEETFQSELKAHGINIEFSDSKQELLLQIIDNIVSVLRHAYDKGIKHFRDKEQWCENSEWDMKLLSKAIRKLSHSHISFTVPLSDWDVALCTEMLFSPGYPKKYRNNFHLNYYYQQNMLQIFKSISSNNLPIDEIIELLGD